MEKKNKKAIDNLSQIKTQESDKENGENQNKNVNNKEEKKEQEKQKKEFYIALNPNFAETDSKNKLYFKEEEEIK